MSTEYETRLYKIALSNITLLNVNFQTKYLNFSYLKDQLTYFLIK